MYKKIAWKVIKWLQLWRTIWFPTANIKIDENIIEEWTYKINVIVENKIFHWVWAYLKDRWVFESHIFDFWEDIYDKEIEVFILYKIRENQKFSSFDDLKTQIQKDKEFAKNTKDIVLTFGTFDVFHEGHKYFLKEAKKYGDYLITVVATDENVLKIKWFNTHFNQFERQKELQNAWISDIVFVWKKDNPMFWLLEYKPKVICLWYDQKWFSYMLDDFIKNNSLDTQVFRINSFNPEVYKSSILKEKLQKNNK